jgi:ABC-type bacteriocin/lantibiotic exporter with double-glycine peptidase domain
MSLEGLVFCIKPELISRRTLIAVLCFAASACAGQALSTKNTFRAPPSHLIGGVPFFKQAAHQCGPAAMASVLNYRGIKVSPEEIIEAIYSKGAEGTLDFDMILYAEKQGRKTEKYRGTLENLRENVDLNNPLIVLVDYGFLSYQRNHFMVVLGYDESHIYVNSGIEPLEAISNDEFVRTWKKTNFWTLLID